MSLPDRPAAGEPVGLDLTEQERWRGLLAGRLRELRASSGLSLVELAAAAHVDLPYYAQLEAGTADLVHLPTDALYRLARAFGTNPRAMLEGLQ